MQLNPYLVYNGDCEAALKFYQNALGARIETMLLFEAAPADMPMPPDWKKKVMHAVITVDGEVLMASDAPPDRYRAPQGFSVALQVGNPAEAERRFKALADGGAVTMPFGQTFFSRGFGMCTDRFGIPWMVNCPAET